MERLEPTSGMLNLMIQPAFTVKDGVIIQVNEGAQKYFLEPNMPVEELLLTGKEEYKELKEGCLYLTLNLSGMPYAASVHPMEDFSLFTIEQEQDQAELQTMALAAQELRAPLSNVMSVADQLFPVAGEDEDPATREQVSRINRGLFQMLRIIGNMSDAYRYSQGAESKQTLVDMTELFGELFEQATALLGYGDVQLRFTNLNKSLICLGDKEKLERAVHNLISNGVKFANKGTPVVAQLVQRQNKLLFSIQSKAEVSASMHDRFRRQPGLEDSRFGIGLGMVLIRAAAAAHGGAVLVDHPDGETRITMTMEIRQSSDNMVRSSALSVDYAGERNHCLVELSDVLPACAYEAKQIN